MGWWNANPQDGGIDNDSTNVWGDTPADLMAELVDAFISRVGRVPSEQEIVAGYRFSLGGVGRLGNPKEDPWAADVSEQEHAELLAVMDMDWDLSRT